MLTEEKITATVAEIINIYISYGNEDYVGEPVSQIEHMCQCAELARASNASDDVILAAFLHDIGHLYAMAFPETEASYMDKFGLVDHEKIGADYLLKKGFSPDVASMVANHVEAKRYLTYKDENYYHQLSDASKKTLDFQGGKMNEAEAEAFEKNPLHNHYLTLRRWDEQAKIVKTPLPDLQYYAYLMKEHLTKI